MRTSETEVGQDGCIYLTFPSHVRPCSAPRRALRRVVRWGGPRDPPEEEAVYHLTPLKCLVGLFPVEYHGALV